MAYVVKPPGLIGGKYLSVFLGGSIEMGSAENWQKMVEDALVDLPIILYNPRRDDWNASWEQRADNPPFREQVEWELNALEQASIIILYFQPGTKSPISLLELGLFASSNKLVVLCPDGFWRKGNVDIVCERYNVVQFENWRDVLDWVRNYVYIKSVKASSR